MQTKEKVSSPGYPREDSGDTDYIDCVIIKPELVNTIANNKEPVKEIYAEFCI